jgi:RHS repeat-associated protein
VTYPWSGGGTKTLTYSYDRFGNRSGLELADGAETLQHTYVYDDGVTDLFDRLKRAVLPGNSGEALAFHYVQSSRGWEEIEQLVWPNDLETDLVYEAHGPISTITVGSPVNDLLDYAGRDAVDRITALDHIYDSTTHEYDFGYDPSGRLTSAQYQGLPPANVSFRYDPAGNREDPNDLGAYEYNENDELEATVAHPVLCYDADGNLTEKRTTGPCGDPAPESFTWDTVSQLRSWTGGGQTASYAHDPFGRRVKKTTGGATTWYLWDGDQLLAEYNGSGVRQVRYAYAGDGFAPKQVAFGTPGSEAVYDVPTDQLDTPRLLTDASGVVVWRAAYEAFGRAHLDSGNTLVEAFNLRFPGQYFDDETGLHYNRHRYYSPELGRYISADPIGQFGTLAIAGVALNRFPSVERRLGLVPANVYSYSLNDPVNLVDPSGEIVAQLIGGAVGAGFGAFTAARSGGDTGDIVRSAAVGAAAGVASTLPIPGINPLLGGALIGGVSAFGGNVATQALVEGKSLECVDFSSAGLSGLAGAIGGGFGAKLAAGKTPSFLSLDPSKASLGMFLTPTGQDVVSSSVGGAVGGVLDALLQ